MPNTGAFTNRCGTWPVRSSAGLWTVARQELPYVVSLSEPPTSKEQLLLAPCRLMRQPIAIMRTKCDTVEEWVKRDGGNGRAS
jgi:hypothetical protein